MKPDPIFSQTTLCHPLCFRQCLSASHPQPTFRSPLSAFSSASPVKPAVCNPSWVCTRIRSRWLPKPGLSTSRTTSNKFLLLFTSHSTHSVLLEQPDWTNTPPHCTDEETKDQKGYTAFPKSGGYQGVSKDSKPTMRTHSHTHSWVIPPLTNSSKNSCSRALRY